MGYKNIDHLNLGKLLQTVFSDGVRNQISADYRDWEYIQKFKTKDSGAREIKFAFQTSYGPSSIQYGNPGQSGRGFPAAQQVTIGEYTATYKELISTIELDYNLWNRARRTPEKYGEPLAIETQAKSTAAKRRLAADFYGDGTGVVGTIKEGSAQKEGDLVRYQLATGKESRGHVGFFEYGDILVSHKLDGTRLSANISVGQKKLAVYWEVVSKDREIDTVLLRPLQADLTPVVSFDSVLQPKGDNYLYRYGQPTIPDLTKVDDYGTVSEVMAGLESLSAGDGRKIHGITMSGMNAGSRVDAGGKLLEIQHLHRALDKAKLSVGQGNYSWKLMCMSPEAHRILVASHDLGRSIQSVKDNKRGINYFAYIHGNDLVETYTSEFVPKNRIYMLPEATSNQGKVLEFWGSDFETVKGEGMSSVHLKPGSGGGHVNMVNIYLQSIAVLIAKHPAAIAVVENFSL